MYLLNINAKTVITPIIAVIITRISTRIEDEGSASTDCTICSEVKGEGDWVEGRFGCRVVLVSSCTTSKQTGATGSIQNQPTADTETKQHVLGKVQVVDEHSNQFTSTQNKKRKAA